MIDKPPVDFYCLPCNADELVIDSTVDTSPGHPYRRTQLVCGHVAVETWSDMDGCDYMIRWEDIDA